VKDLWDRIAASSPLDSTAASVTSESRDTPQERVYSRLHWKAPPFTRKSTHSETSNPEYEDFTGCTFGRLTVLGIHALSTSNKQVWVVRCACGDYETRRAKAIRKADPRDACEDCARLEYLRTRETQKAAGAIKQVTVEEAVEAIKKGGARG
jgi:hypothetical protein